MKCYLDYEHNILQVMNAVRAYEGISTYHEEDSQVKVWLQQHDFEQIIVVLIDGMGVKHIQDDCEKKGFLHTYLAKTVSTVYPPTTVAATTSILTGKAPCATAWLGWQQYFKDIDQHLIMFLNKNYYTKQNYENALFTYQSVPILTMVEECEQHGISAKEIYPAFRKDGVSSFEDMCDRFVKESQTLETKFIYAYWDAYDTICHKKGKYDLESIQVLRNIDKRLEEMSLRLSKKTGMIVIADHGQIEVETKYLIDYPDLLECFRVLPSIEGRTQSFFIKKDNMKVFKERFLTHFQDTFILYTKQEVLDLHLFGFDEPHPRFEEFLGDYIACAIANVTLCYDESYMMKGNHAGMTQEELAIPVILYPK